ncbi:MAG: hypothetical protein ONB27_05485 [candidate division KSB1 bacterium]|nr:hypothetical protein [candidate division KSB1 bacterium]
MKRQFFLALLVLGSIVCWAGDASSGWPWYSFPRLIAGGSIGLFRASLENFPDLYDSRWGGLYAGQANVRVYKSNFLSVQYGQFRKTATVDLSGLKQQAEWDERLLNVGIRWYAEPYRQWRLYSGFGFNFVQVHEKAHLSLLKPTAATDVTSSGRGFYLEIGTDMVLLPNFGLNLELEVSSASKGGAPGFMGSSLGGYLLGAGLNFYL